MAAYIYLLRQEHEFIWPAGDPNAQVGRALKVGQTGNHANRRAGYQADNPFECTFLASSQLLEDAREVEDAVAYDLFSCHARMRPQSKDYWTFIPLFNEEHIVEDFGQLVEKYSNKPLLDLSELPRLQSKLSRRFQYIEDRQKLIAWTRGNGGHDLT